MDILFVFISSCLFIVLIIVIIQVTITQILANRKKEKYEKAREELAESIKNGYLQILGKGEDATVYYNWAIEIYTYFLEYGMFSLDEALEKSRKAYELATGELRMKAEVLLKDILFYKYLDSDKNDLDEEDKNQDRLMLTKELENLFNSIAERDTNLVFLLEWGWFKMTKGIAENNLEDIEIALSLYKKIEKEYSSSDQKERDSVNINEFYSNWSKLLITTISKMGEYKYLPELLEILEKLRTIPSITKMDVNLQFAKYHSLKYLASKDIAELEKIDQICEIVLSERTSDTDKSVVYDKWAYLYKEIADILEDEALLNKAKEKYQRALDLDENNLSALKTLAILYANEGMMKNDDLLFNQAVTMLLKHFKKISIVDETELSKEEADNLFKVKFELLDIASKIVRNNEDSNPKTETKRLYINIGEAFISTVYILQLGYFIKAKGMLFAAAMDNNFEKQSKKILRVINEGEKVGDIHKKNELFKDIRAYAYAGYYAQIPGQEDLMYQYLKEYIESYHNEDLQLLLEKTKEDPVFRNHKHSSQFNNVFNPMQK